MKIRLPLRIDYRYLVQTISLVVLLCVPRIVTAAGDATRTIKFYHGGWGLTIQAYQEELLSELLRVTEYQYGKVKLEVYPGVMSASRADKELGYGRHIHIMFNARKVSERDFRITSPILQSVLGLRNLVVLKKHVPIFQSIDSFQDFRIKSVGQVLGWHDSAVYMNAGINVIEALEYSKLFTMLNAERFNYIPLSIVEARGSLLLAKEGSEKFELLDNVYIYYPWPIYINISHHYPELVDRINYGIKRMLDSGLLERIFHKHFHSYLDQIEKDNSKVIVLVNPEMSALENNDATQRVLMNYFSSSRVIWPPEN